MKRRKLCGRALAIPRPALARPVYAEDMSYLVRFTRLRLARGQRRILH